MARLIDADALMENIAKIAADETEKVGRIIIAVTNATTVDAVPVVRCKDCTYRWNPDTCPMCHEEQIEWDDDGYTESDWILHDRTQDDGFCEGGERKTDG